MIDIENVSKGYADKTLFENVSLSIYDGERVGIVGPNGAGKTTLVRLIAGDEEPDKGRVVCDGSIGYLRQITEYDQEAFLQLCELGKEAGEFLKYASLLHVSENIDFTLERLKMLSGGEKTKLMLAGILSYNPQILILDEPTNHMDSQGADWLIKALGSYNGTIIAVSHDRYFLNQVVDRIIEVENGQVQDFYGNYSEYKRQKDQQLEQLQNKYEQQRAEARKIDRQIRQLNDWANKGEGQARRQGGMMSDSRIKGAETKAQVSAGKLAAGAKAKASRLEQAKNEFIDRPYVEGEVHYGLVAKPIGSKVLVRGENIKKRFGDRVLFDGGDFTILAGEKVALKGNNGSGKTTLIKMILGQDDDYEGLIWTAPSLKAAYLSQDVLDLDQNMTVMELAKSGGSAEYVTQFLSNLAAMNMNRQVFNRKISTLSLGERMRIKMCELILSDFNLIILDEPTNHLDLANKLFLEKVLKDYNGAMLLVSHDRELTKNVCDQEIDISDRKIVKKNYSKPNDEPDC